MTTTTNFINTDMPRKNAMVVFETHTLDSAGYLVYDLRGFSLTRLLDPKSKIAQVVLLAHPVKRGYFVPLDVFTGLNILHIKGRSTLLVKPGNRTLKKYLIWDNDELCSDAKAKKRIKKAVAECAKQSQSVAEKGDASCVMKT